MLRLLKSIKTALVILFLSITVFVAGSIYIPRNLSLFSDINDIPLFRWLSLNYSSIGKTFWIYLAIFLMAARGSEKICEREIYNVSLLPKQIERCFSNRHKASGFRE
jgi:hypothetical protein